jgi:hypothetical protein
VRTICAHAAPRPDGQAYNLVPRRRCFYGFQIMTENVHAETFSLLIDAFLPDVEEQARLFDEVESGQSTTLSPLGRDVFPDKFHLQSHRSQGKSPGRIAGSFQHQHSPTGSSLARSRRAFFFHLPQRRSPRSSKRAFSRV